MMTKRELLNAYRAAVIELEELRRQLQRVGTDGRPSGIRNMQADAIRGTNDPATAAMQLADGLEGMLHRKEEALAQLTAQVDALLRSIRDFRTYMVIYHYYVLGHTDEQVAHAISVSRVRALQLRQRYLDAA